MTSRTPRFGLSYIEIVLVMGLISGLLTLVALYFQKAKQFASDTQTYARVHRQADTALQRMRSDIASGTSAFSQVHSDGLYFLSSGSGESTESQLDFHPDSGRILWQRWIGHSYLPEERELVRVAVPLNSSISEQTQTPLPEVDPLQFRRPTQPGRRLIARDISRFSVHRAGQTVFVSLTAQARSPVPRIHPEDQIVEVTVETQIPFIN